MDLKDYFINIPAVKSDARKKGIRKWALQRIIELLELLAKELAMNCGRIGRMLFLSQLPNAFVELPNPANGQTEFIMAFIAVLES